MIVTPVDYATKPSVRRFADEVLARLGITDVPGARVMELDVSEGEVVMWQRIPEPVRWCDHHCHGLTSRGVPILCGEGTTVLRKRTRYNLSTGHRAY